MRKIVLLALVILVILFTTFIRLNIFTIRSLDVELEKVDCVNTDQIRNSSHLLGQNFFIINSAKIENDLKDEYFCIKSAKISRYFSDKVKLFILGREPAAILVVLKNEATKSGLLEKFSEIQATPSAEASASGVTQLFMNPYLPRDDSDRFAIDNEGVVYSKNVEQIYAPRVYVSGLNLTLGQKLNQDLIESLIKILEKVKTFGVDVKDAEIYSEKLLLINAVPRIIFKLYENIDTQIASLQLILKIAKIDSKELEFIDLRFDKPIVRFAPKKNGKR